MTDPVTTQPEGDPLESGWLTNTVRKRYGWMMLFFLLTWTGVGFVAPLKTLITNALLLDTYVQLAMLTGVNFVAVIFCLGIVRLLNHRFPSQGVLDLAGNGTLPWSKSMKIATCLMAAVTPLVLVWKFNSEFAYSGGLHWLWSLAAIVTAMAVSWFGLKFLGRVRARLFGSVQDAENYLPFECQCPDGKMFESHIGNEIGKCITATGKKFGLEDVDFVFAGYLLLLAIGHWCSVRWMSASKVWLTSTPLLVVLLIWLAFMLLAGVSNLFDRYRLPVIPLLLVGLTIWQIPRGSTMPLQTTEYAAEGKFGELVDAAGLNEPEVYLRDEDLTKPFLRSIKRLNEVACETINSRMRRLVELRSARSESDRSPAAAGKTLVMVTCPGGGIHAAGWASCVLDSISHEYSDFADAVCVISGVSGGSVGTLYFASTRYRESIAKGNAEDALSSFAAGFDRDPVMADIYRKSPALALASQSALEPIAYGLMTDDLYGTLWSGLATKDRGQRLEEVFESNLPKSQRGITMSHWGDVARRGEMPVVIFNSTDAATGRRILFDSIPTPRRLSNVSRSSRPINYRELLGKKDGVFRDVTPAAAARTSATFPYISPFTRPDFSSQLGSSVALCDGGYADNEGIVTAINWVQFCLQNFKTIPADKQEELVKEFVDFDRILLIRIEPTPSARKQDVDSKEGLMSWVRWVTGPVEAIFNVRSTSQAERGNLESDLAYWTESDRWQQTDQQQGGESPSDDSSPNDTADEEDDPDNKAITKNVFLVNRSAKSLEEGKGKNANATFADKRPTETRRVSQWGTKQQWDEKVKTFRSRVADGLMKKLEEEKEFVPDGGDTSAAESLSDVQETQAMPQSDSKLVVLKIQFPSFDQPVPLNWKLSKEQKLWYSAGWETCSAPETIVRRTLDQYFTPSQNYPRPSSDNE